MFQKKKEEENKAKHETEGTKIEKMKKKQKYFLSRDGVAVTVAIVKENKRENCPQDYVTRTSRKSDNFVVEAERSKEDYYIS